MKYSREVLDRAIAMKPGMTWAQVAARLGVDQDGLEVHVCNYKKGKLKFAGGKGKAKVAMFEAGASVSEIARHYGQSLSAICTTLAYHGLDAEMRSEWREVSTPSS